MLRILILVLCLTSAAVGQGYHDNTGRGDVLAGGARMIPVDTPAGTYRVWTKRVGNNPKLKLLLLHGGPGSSSEYFEAMDSYLPGAEIEYYYYDQLGSYRSDKPDNDDLWRRDRFVEEVEQVRTALGLGPDNFCLLGHSWGGILAIEYALKYQANLKCLVISNMMSSIKGYNAYAERVLAKRFDPAALAKIKAYEAAEDFSNPEYLSLLEREHYERHVLRMPAATWPDPVQRAFAHTNSHIYVLMQGPSEFGLRGRLLDWERFNDLKRIDVPALVIMSQWDTMDPAHMQAMARELPQGVLLNLPDGSHMAMYDDQQRYMRGLISFMKSLED